MRLLLCISQQSQLQIIYLGVWPIHGCNSFIHSVVNVCRMEDIVQAWLLRTTDLEVRQLL